MCIYICVCVCLALFISLSLSLSIAIGIFIYKGADFDWYFLLKDFFRSRARVFAIKATTATKTVANFI